MLKVLVLDRNKKPLMPCHPARARELLARRKAAVFRRFPFVIILKERDGGEIQPLELKLDPGSKTTGVALVSENKSGRKVVWAGEINHRGQAIRDALLSRRQIRRGRRNRKTRYRAPRFDNRTRPQGWLAPSLKSRVDNCVVWADRLKRTSPVSSIAVETVRFDMQAMQNPEIAGVEYQQGELAGYEVREYLLEKWGHKCAYCGAENVPLQIEHVVSKSKGGSNRVSNLAIACKTCNEAKGNRDVKEFLARKPEVLRNIIARLKMPLKDAAAVNATRYAIGDSLKTLDLPVSFWSGGRTKFNRVGRGYPKAHWIDAACVGETGRNVYAPDVVHPLTITATGRGSRQMCRMDRFGFPRTSPKTARSVYGFKTGDLVRAVVPGGKKAGTYSGRVAVRATGSFNIRNPLGVVQGISHRHCKLIQHADGYGYSVQPKIATGKEEARKAA
jgi:5-methylcytosine-specific restriction endonuclease McrA